MTLNHIRSKEPNVKVSIQHSLEDHYLIRCKDKLFRIVDLTHACILHLTKLHLAAAKAADTPSCDDLVLEIPNRLNVVSIVPRYNNTSKLTEII